MYDNINTIAACHTIPCVVVVFQYKKKWYYFDISMGVEISKWHVFSKSFVTFKVTIILAYNPMAGRGIVD